MLINAAANAKRKGDIKSAVPSSAHGGLTAKRVAQLILLVNTGSKEVRDAALLELNHYITPGYTVYYDPGQDHYNVGAQDLTEDDAPAKSSSASKNKSEGGGRCQCVGCCQRRKNRRLSRRNSRRHSRSHSRHNRHRRHHH